MQSLFIPFDRVHEDGTVDWIKVGINYQLIYQKLLTCNRRMRSKKYHRENIPSKSREPTWYGEYVMNTSGKLFSVGSRKAIKFGRKFRLPYSSLNELTVDIRGDNDFC